MTPGTRDLLECGSRLSHDVFHSGRKNIINLRGRSPFQSPSYLSMEMLHAVMGGAPFGWPFGTYVSDGRFPNIAMAMGTELTRNGAAIRGIAGSEEEQKDLARSYGHLCELRDEVVRMGIIPEVAAWRLNFHV